jgi:hypothetical protein
MRRIWVVLAALALDACGSNALPPPNSVQSQFDPQASAIRIIVSDLQPLFAANLIAPDGSRYPATAVTLISGPHVDYRPPPSLGIGIGGFGFSGCCSGFGSGVGVGFPLGQPTVSHVTDQYVGSAVIPVPVKYTQSWRAYHLEIEVGDRPVVLSAPAPPDG